MAMAQEGCLPGYEQLTFTFDMKQVIEAIEYVPGAGFLPNQDIMVSLDGDGILDLTATKSVVSVVASPDGVPGHFDVTFEYVVGFPPLGVGITQMIDFIIASANVSFQFGMFFRDFTVTDNMLATFGDGFLGVVTPPSLIGAGDRPADPSYTGIEPNTWLNIPGIHAPVSITDPADVFSGGGVDVATSLTYRTTVRIDADQLPFYPITNYFTAEGATDAGLRMALEDLCLFDLDFDIEIPIPLVDTININVDLGCLIPLGTIDRTFSARDFITFRDACASGSVVISAPAIASTKEFTEITPWLDDSTRVSFDIKVANVGGDTLMNFILSDNLMTGLDGAFGRLVDLEVLHGFPMADMLPGENASYGGGSANLLDGTGRLLPGESFIVRVTAIIDPASKASAQPFTNQAMVVATVDAVNALSPTVSDLTDSGSDPTGFNPGAPGATANSHDDPTPFTTFGELTLTKQILSAVDATSATPGNFDVMYEFILTNSGPDQLINISLIENFQEQYGIAFVEIVGAPAITSSTATSDPSLATSPVFNGGIGNNIFTGTDGILDPGDSITVQLTAEVDVSEFTKLTSRNQALVSGIDINFPGIPVEDASDEGLGGGPNDPTGMIGIPQLGVSKMVTQVLSEGSDDPTTCQVEYLLKVRNNGTDTLVNVSLEDPLSTQINGLLDAEIVMGSFIGSAYVIGTEEAFDGDAEPNLFTGASLAPGQELQIKFVATYDNFAGNLGQFNSAIGRADGLQSMTMAIDSSENGADPSGDDIDGDGSTNTPTPMPSCSNVSIAKAFTGATLQHNGNYIADFEIVVANAGNDTLSEMHIVDELTSQFGCVFKGTISNTSIETVSGDVIALPTLNPNFNGSSNTLGDLLEGDGLIGPGGQFRVRFSAELDPDCRAVDRLSNQVTVIATSANSGAEVSDLSDSGLNPLDSNGGGGFNDPTLVPIPAIGVSKRLEACYPVPDADGEFYAHFRYKIQNTGNVTLDSVELEDPIFDQFGSAALEANVVPGSFVGASLVPGSFNSTFDGTGAATPQDLGQGADLLDGNALLLPGTFIQLDVLARLDASEVPWPDTLFNNAVGFATAADTTNVTVMDSSENDIQVDFLLLADGADQNFDWDVNTPTPLKPLPAIGVAKRQIDCQDAGEENDGNVIVTFEYLIENIGSAPLANIQLIEDFSANKNLGDAFVRVVGDSSSVMYIMTSDSIGMAPDIDPNFDGAPNDINIFDGISGLLYPGDSLIIVVAAEVDPNALFDYPADLPIENSARAEGEYSLQVVADESYAGTDPSGGDSAIVVHAPALGLLKQVIAYEPAASGVVANFDVTYKYTLSNVGTDSISNLQIADSLASFFGPAFVDVVIPPMVLPSPMASMNPTENGGYDGDGMVDLLLGTDGELAPGDTVCVELTVEVDPNAMNLVDTLFSMASATGEAPGLDGVGPDPKEVFDPSDNQDIEGGDDPTGIGIGDIKLTKDIISIDKAASGVPGNVDARFKLVIKNKGNVDLRNITVLDDVQRQLGSAYVGVVDLPVVTHQSTDTPFNFGAFPPVLIVSPGIDSLAPKDSFCLEFALEIDPNAVGAEKVLKNFAVVVAEDALGIEYQDTSDAGYLPAEHNLFHPDDPSMPPLLSMDSTENDPLCLWLPSVGLAKKVTSVGAPTAGVHEIAKPWQFEASYKMVLENTGNTDLDSLSLVDTISEQWGGIAPLGAFIRIKPNSLQIVGEETNATFLDCFTEALNLAYDGTAANPMILIPESCRLLSGERITIEFKVSVSAKYGPEDEGLVNQAEVWARGIRPVEAATKPGVPVTVLDYDSSIAAGMQIRDTVWTHDLSDSGLDPESYNEDDPFDLGTGDDPTVLPNCWKDACDLTCVSHIEKPLGQDCEVEVTAEMVLKSFDQVCIDLGFINVVVTDPTGAVIRDNIITREMARFSDGPYQVCVNNIVCPEQYCCSELTIREIKEPWIEGALDTTLYCIDPFLGLDPNDLNYPKPEVRSSCEGLGFQGPTFDYEWVNADMPCESPYAKVIYRIWYATDAIGGNRVDIFDEIYVLKLPELSKEHIWCPPSIDEYCGDTVAICPGPRIILPSLNPAGGAPDTLCLTPGFDSVLGKCGLYVESRLDTFAGECPTVYKETFEIKQECYNSSLNAIPAPDTGGVMQLGDHYFVCEWWRTVYDTLAPWIACVEEVDTVLTGTHDCAAHVYLNDVQVSDECSRIKGVKVEIVELGLRTLLDSMGYDAKTQKTIYGNHSDLFKLEVGTDYTIVYEATDQCHNRSYDTCYIHVKDRTDPVVVVDKGLTVSLSDKKVWMNAEDLDEGSWDNCGINLFLARRTDWYEACIDLCDNIDDCYVSEHHDTLWQAILADDKSVDEVEAHYSKVLEWLGNDGIPCGDLIYNSWIYDLMKYATIHCAEHPYELDEATVHKLIKEAYGSISDKFKDVDHNTFGDLLDTYSQIGGGWSDQVPFDCDDACAAVTVEVLAMDYWCNWSTGWAEVWVEDKTPVTVATDVVDGEITCKIYKDRRYTYPGEDHPVALEYIVNQAVAGDNDAHDLLDEVLGGYEKAWLDPHGNYIDGDDMEIDRDIEFIDSSCACDQDTIIKIRVYDDHLGYIWKDSLTRICGYEATTEKFEKGVVLVNCPSTVQCAQEVWLDLDHCGQGYIHRKFKIWQGCPPDSEAYSPHTADTIYRSQRIYVGNDCDLNKYMFEVPGDVTVEACGVEYDPDGSGNIVGGAGVENTGIPIYQFDDDCRIVGIAHSDQVFKIVGGDEGCLKIVRTWYFADWCDAQPTSPNWYENSNLVDFTCQQKILVIDVEEPECVIMVTTPTEGGSGTAEDPADLVVAGGCSIDLAGFVDIMDPCGLIDLDWEVKDLKGETVVESGSAILEGDMDSYEFDVVRLSPGEYKFQVRVTDECQNESYCDYYFNVGAGKKPGPVCITSLTVELQAWDSDQDGVIDTAKSVVWADEFESSSLAPCGEDYTSLTYGIEWMDEATDEYDADRVADSLLVGCDRAGGTFMVRMWVISESGAADYCDVFVTIADNGSACQNSSGSSVISGLVTNTLNETIGAAEVSVRKVDGSVLSSMTTGRRGFYALGSPYGVDLEVSVSKDGDDRNGVSTLDLILLQKHLLGKANLSDPMEHAADVNNDSRVSVADLVMLRKLILGIDETLTHSDSWRFHAAEDGRESYAVENFSDRMEIDWIGLKIGDLNMDYDPRRAQGRSAEQLVLKVSDQVMEAGAMYRVSLSSSQDMAGLRGYQYTMQFAPEAVRIVSIDETGTLGMGLENFGQESINEGTLSVSWHDVAGGSSNLEPGDVMYSVVIEAQADARLSEVLTLGSKITRAEAYNDDEQTMAVALEFVEEGDLAQGFELHQNRPNPFLGQTVISFTLPERQRATLTIYDGTGRMLKRYEREYDKGYNMVDVKLGQIAAQGILYYQLDTKEFTASRKMTMVN